MQSLKRKLLTASLLLASAAHAQAHEIENFFGTPITWPNRTATIRASSVSFPPGSFRDALSNSRSAWTNCPSRFTFGFVTGDTSVGLNNGQNEAWFSSDDNILSGAPAVCWRWNFAASWTEADVIFSSAVTWTTSTNKTAGISYGGGARPFFGTSLHELGHALGLSHENDEYNIMGQDWNHIHANSSSCRQYPGEDGSDGAVSLYGSNGSATQDLAVVHWRRSGNSGEYSAHARTRAFNSSGTLLPSFTDTKFNSNGEPGFRAQRGQTIQVEFSFENNGRTTQSTSVEFVLSTNDNITTFDQDLTSRSMTLSRNSVFTSRTNVTIPTNLNVGDVIYIGAIVDPTNAIAEGDESNNSTYIAIRIDS